MKGGESKLIAYMDGSMKRFIIPVYQRNYDWKIENCKRLYDDLTKVITHKRKSHFFGSIVYVDDTCGRNSDFLVIDGQQRLTTISLLFLAMYNLLEKGIVVSNDEFLSKRIYEDFLVDKYQPKETRIKLKSIKSDRKAFSVLFDEEEESILDSNITVNYKYFYERIQKHEISIDELFNAIEYNYVDPEVFALYAATDSYMTYKLNVIDENNTEITLLKTNSQVQMDSFTSFFTDLFVPVTNCLPHG